MSTALSLTFDPASGGPTALGLARLGPWAVDERILRRFEEALEPLPGLDALAAHWGSWFNSTPRRAPGPFFLDEVRRLFPAPGYEREAFEASLQRAQHLEPTLLVKHELRNLENEMARQATEDASAFYRILRGAVEDLKRVGSARKTSAFVVHPDFLEKAQWTVANLELFLAVHWALTHASRDIRKLLERRRAAFDASRGTVRDAVDLADAHDEAE